MNLFNSDPNSFEFEISGLKNYKDPGYNLLKKPILIRINKILLEYISKRFSDHELFSLSLIYLSKDIVNIIFESKLNNNFILPKSGMITRLEKKIEKRIAQPVINFSKIMKSLLIESDYIYRPKFLLNKNDILSFSLSPLMKNFKKKKIVINQYREWFFIKGIQNIGKLTSFEKFSSSKFDLILDELSIKNSNLVKKMIYKKIYEYINFINKLVKSFSLSQRFLPKFIYVGTLGNLFNRVISFYGKKNNSVVFAFDHGSGAGLVDDELSGFMEWMYVNNYVTYSEAQKRNINYINSKYKYIKNKKLKVFSNSIKQKYVNSNTKEFKDIKNILFVMTCFSNFEINMPNFNSNMYQTDYLYKILSTLTKLGFDVTTKPHPECKFGLPKKIKELLKLNVENSSFENCYTKYDCIIIDYFRSSVTRNILYSNKPIIIIDHNNNIFAPQVFQNLKKRASIMKIGNSNKRARIDEKEMMRNIQESLKKSSDLNYLKMFYS